jgi:hypothetical protein
MVRESNSPVVTVAKRDTINWQDLIVTNRMSDDEYEGYVT